MDSDEMLAAQAAMGDCVAFEALVVRYQTRLYRLVLLLAGESLDAEDLTQETFIRAYRAIRQFRQDSSFRTWLHRIAINVVRSHLARRGQRASLDTVEPTPEAENAAREAASSCDDPETVLIRRQAIDRALATLSTEARLVVTLRDIQGLEYQEIATITGVPIGTVESRLFRARRRLRPLLAPLRSLYKSQQFLTL